MLSHAPLKIAVICAGVALGIGVTRLHLLYKGEPAAVRLPPAATAEALGRARQLKTVLSQKNEREAIFWLRMECGSWASTDFAAAAAELMAMGPGRPGRLLAEVARNWAGCAPLEALAFLDSVPEGVANDLFPLFASGWAERDADGLLAWDGLKGLSYTRYQAIAAALVPYRPEEAIRLAGEASEAQGGRSGFSYYELFTDLAATDPNRALALFKTLPERAQSATIPRLYLGWSSIDPDAAMAWMESLPKGPVRESGFQEIIQMLALSSPREAAEIAMRELASKDASLNMAYVIVQKWAERDFAEAREFFSKQPNSAFKRNAMQRLDGEWASRKPEEFLDDLLDKQTLTSEKMLWVSTAASALIQQDPEAYTLWFRRNLAEIPPDQISPFLWGSFHEHPALGAELLALLPEGRHADHAYQLLASQWVPRDVEGAREFLSTLPEGSARQYFEAAMIGSLASTNVSAALKEAESVAEPEKLSQILSNIISNSQDPATVAAWIQTRPESPEITAASHQLISNWSFRDAKGAGKWIATLPEGAPKQEAIRAYTFQIARDHPSTALEWAEKIKDKGRREETMASIAQQWSEVDEAAALEWVKGAALPDYIKRYFIKE